VTIAGTLTAALYTRTYAVNFGLIQVDAGVTATISGLTISAGSDTGPPAESFNGGGISNSGTLTVTGCTISNNTSGNGSGVVGEGPYYGGGIYNASSGTMTLANSTVTDNAGGIYNLGTLTVSASTDSDNTDEINGDGAGIDNLGTLSVADSTISNNSANDGGGFFNSGMLMIANSTIANNDAQFGGGIFTGGALTLVNCTISGNTLGGNSSTYGGAAGGGIYLAGGTAILVNTIVAGNKIPVGNLAGAGGLAGYAASDIAGTLSSASAYNLIGGGGAGGLHNGVSGNVVLSASTNPLLGTLAENGGPTQTMPLLPGSPAIGAGSLSLAVDPVSRLPLATDQRGAGFPRTSEGTVDIGAYERPVAGGPATVYTVDLTSASGTGSGNSGDLVYAINQANANTNPAGSVIEFAPTVFNASTPQAITLSRTLVLSEAVGPEVIDGPGANVLMISGNNAVTVFGINDNVVASLAGLTISNGSSGTGNGGGIDNAGYLTVTSSTITSNTNNEGGEGGGIFNTGFLVLANSAVTKNSANFGGGIFSAGTMTAINTTVALNDSSDYSSGGALYSEDPYNLYFGYALALTNCTIADNADAGLDIGNEPVSLNNTIVALNYYLNEENAADIMSITAGSISSSSANNLIGTGRSGDLQNGVNGNLVGISDPGLGSLADNGGPTPTIALRPGSPAIDAGSAALAVDPTTGLPLTTDQRGAGYARIVDGTVDIGAFESQASSGATAAPTITGEQVRTAGKGRHTSIEGFELSFSEPLNASRAKNAANYVVTQTVKHRRKLATQRVKLRVEYKAGSDTVSLILSSRSSFALGGQLVVNASSPKGITDTSGVYLDGSGDGAPGSDAVFVILPDGQGLTG